MRFKELVAMPGTHTNRPGPSEAALEIQGLIKRSRAAQTQIADYTQEQVDALIRAVVWSVSRPGMAEKIAKHSGEETQLGNYDGKYMKIFRKARAAMIDIINDKSVGVIEEDKTRNIIKIAKPVGVIGALSPSTNPEGTPVIKSISAIKGRNSIIIAPHPRAKLTNKMIVDLMRGALVDYGAPADLIIGIETPSLEKTDELMKQCDRVLATGGSAMVKAAYSSGTPSFSSAVSSGLRLAMAVARINQREKCALITGNRDIGGLRSCRSQWPGSISRKVPSDFSIGGDEAYGDAQNRGSSGVCRLIHTQNHQLINESATGRKTQPKGH